MLAKRRRPRVGEFVILRKKSYKQGESNKKLTSQAEKFSLKVTTVTDDGSHIWMDQGDHDEMISRDRVEVVPRLYFGPNDELTDQVNFHRRNEYEYVLDEIVGHRVKEDNPKEWLEAICKWYSFKQNTYEPSANVRRSHISRYCRKNGLILPNNARESMME